MAPSGSVGSSRRRPIRMMLRQVPALRERWVAILLLAFPLIACNAAGGNPEARKRYEADKERCARVSADEGAQKSCMVYRGWPDGKFR